MAKSAQCLKPAKKVKTKKGKYEIYPTLPIEEGKVFRGYTSLTKSIANEKVIVIDGYSGIFFDDFRNKLEDEFALMGEKLRGFRLSIREVSFPLFSLKLHSNRLLITAKIFRGSQTG